MGFHHKPCGLFNINGYYGKLIDFLDSMVEQEFLNPLHRDLILVDDDPANLLRKMKEYNPPRIDKAAWIRKLSERIDPSD